MGGQGADIPHNAHYSTDLVVALEHLDEVARTLERLGIAFGEPERSTDLGLGRLPLGDAHAAARAIDADLARAGLARDDLPSSRPRSAMDRVLRGLRVHFAQRYAGWTPTIGKNRLVGEVVGGGKISHGGGSSPQATACRLPLRPAHPGRGVRVGVLDSAIAAHPWLAGGWVSPAADVLDGGGHRVVAGHATFVAGLVLAQAPGCVVDARQVLSGDDGEADSWTVAQEIVEIGKTGLDILNLSFVCYTEDGQPPLVLSAAIDRLDPGVVVVAAAGNHGDLTEERTEGDRRKPAWPAALDHVVAVGAADRQGIAAPFTPSDVPWIDVLAPGVDVVSTFLTGSVNVGAFDGPEEVHDFDGFASWSGTSFAAASVSGAIAARTVPGRTPPRAAWHELRSSAATGNGGRPEFLALDVSADPGR